MLLTFIDWEIWDAFTKASHCAVHKYLCASTLYQLGEWGYSTEEAGSGAQEESTK